MVTVTAHITESMETVTAGGWGLDTATVMAIEDTDTGTPDTIHLAGDLAVGGLVLSITPAAILDIQTPITMEATSRATTTRDRFQSRTTLL